MFENADVRPAQVNDIGRFEVVGLLFLPDSELYLFGIIVMQAIVVYGDHKTLRTTDQGIRSDGRMK
ncbi:hypothetical protein D3C87_1819750 [compost metagenome]